MRTFVSSPYSSLEDAREEVATKLGADHEAIGMENFGSTGLAPLETCLEALDTCEACVLILGGRYGSRVLGLDISYTEAEFEHGRRRGIRVFAYRAEDLDALIEDTEQPEADKTAQREFVSKVLDEVAVDPEPFSSPTELAEAVLRDLERWGRQRRRPRFERGEPSNGKALTYSNRAVINAEARLFGKPVVLVDVGAAHLEKPPPEEGSRTAWKLHEVSRDLERKDQRVLIFNELPVNDTREDSYMDSRIRSLAASDALVVLIVGKASDLERVEAFSEAGEERAAWKPVSIAMAENIADLKKVASFTPEELSKCTVAFEIERFAQDQIGRQVLERTIDAHR
jgi:hypothetical protein